jgi:uncharacterized protein (DUF433 family)
MSILTDISTLIVSTEGVCGGRPRLQGTRITVQYIVNEIKAGVTPEEIVTDKPFLSLASIYAALSYYYVNKETLDAQFARYDDECNRLEAKYTAGNLL